MRDAEKNFASEKNSIGETALANAATFKLDDYVEKIFFLSALIVIAAGVVIGYFQPDINSGPKNFLNNNLFNARGICLGVFFGVINFRGWKLFARFLLASASRDKNALSRFGFFLIFKLTVLFLFVGGLSRFGTQYISGFLFGLASYSILGAFLVTFAQVKRKNGQS